MLIGESFEKVLGEFFRVLIEGVFPKFSLSFTLVDGMSGPIQHFSNALRSKITHLEWLSVQLATDQGQSFLSTIFLHSCFRYLFVKTLKNIAPGP